MEVIKTNKGQLSILTGKTDMGKSTIAVYNCSEQIKKGESVLFFSYEYCQSILYNKLMSHFDLKWQDLLNLNVVDGRDLSLEDVVTTIRKKAGTFDSVYVDYLDLLRNCTYEVDKKEFDDTKLEQFQVIISTLASLANELQIKIVILSQERADATFENTVEELNKITSTVPGNIEVIKMFIGRDEIFNPLIKCNDISHVVLVEGYNLKHFASINIKETYKGE